MDTAGRIDKFRQKYAKFNKGDKAEANPSLDHKKSLPVRQAFCCLVVGVGWSVHVQWEDFVNGQSVADVAQRVARVAQQRHVLDPDLPKNLCADAAVLGV